jgi:hypothetical protein
MKKFLFVILAACLALTSMAQSKGSMLYRGKQIAPAIGISNIDNPTVVGRLNPNTIVSNKRILDDPASSVTLYDEQTNASMASRCYLYPDGTVGTTATWSQVATPFADRGAGYNYYDGTSFGPEPTARIETIRTGWSNYQPFGANGEIVISHQAAGNLVMCSRTTKGTGAWAQQVLPNALPSGVVGMFWPRMVTNGTNHTNIHVIALTEPVANGGALYNGMDGAPLYCNSLDGGVTFSAWTQLPGMTSADYSFIEGDSYSFAEPKGNTIAFTMGGDVLDLFLMKSTDNGTTWTKTVIWHSLYDLNGSSPHFFNCPGGSQSVVLDNTGTAHVAVEFSQDSAYAASNHYYNRTAYGIIYWNEHMAQLRQDCDWDSLFKSHQMIAWLKDTNVIHFPLANLTETGGPLTRYPQLVIDDNNKIFLVYSAATMLTDPSGNNFHHLFGRDGTLSADTVLWSNDTLVEITSDFLQFYFSECTFPAVSPTTDANSVYILFQKDDYAGSYVQSIGAIGFVGQSSPDSNYMVLHQWTKPINVGIHEQNAKPAFTVGQNFPNPVDGLTKVNVYLMNSGDLSLKLTNLTGQTLMNMEKSNVQPGVSQFVIDASQLPAGVYFYTVKQGDKSSTKKMIVD